VLSVITTIIEDTWNFISLLVNKKREGTTSGNRENMIWMKEMYSSFI